LSPRPRNYFDTPSLINIPPFYVFQLPQKVSKLSNDEKCHKTFRTKRQRSRWKDKFGLARAPADLLPEVGKTILKPSFSRVKANRSPQQRSRCKNVENAGRVSRRL
jgi:hypothetical protein